MTLERWDIFCNVIDNYGDVGVCWRLARQLAREYGLRVRLYIDDLSVLRNLAPQMHSDADEQHVDGVLVCAWRLADEANAVPADVVIEAFACNLPMGYLEKMIGRDAIWINLEYLSAETWVEGCHGLSSIHPQLGLRKRFFFPGFSAHTGGLLKEGDLEEARQTFQNDTDALCSFWDDNVGARPDSDTLTISMFAYENEAMSSLLDAWAANEQPIFLVVPAGYAAAALGDWCGRHFRIGEECRRGALRAVVIPFLSQTNYDRLLWACDLNFVRGEDSFVRAQWARRPFVWHVYPQDEGAHFDKLAAFLDRYETGLQGSAAVSLKHFSEAWNKGVDVGPAWRELQVHLPALREHAGQWAEHLSQNKNLAAGLYEYCHQRASKPT